MQGAQPWSVVFVVVAVGTETYRDPNMCVTCQLVTRFSYLPRSHTSPFSLLPYQLTNEREENERERERTFGLKQKYGEFANHQIRMILSHLMTGTKHTDN